MSATDIEDLAETGLGALVLAFGVIAGPTIYVSDSLGSVPVVFDRFLAALLRAVLPSLSMSVWPSALALAIAATVALRLRDRFAVRASAFVAVYLFVAVVLYYVAA